MPLETVNTVVVQDREYGQDGKPLVNQEVTVRLAPSVLYLIAAGADGNTDQVALQQVEQRTKTDATGFWSVALVSNSVITPANTYYSVKVGLLKTYDIAIPAGAGPFIASNNLTGPLPIFPGGSSVAGPITITGNLSVTGTGTYTGALAANGGLTALGGASISGGLSLSGALTMTDAASRIIPGATSFSIRDTANANDNLLVSNAGLVTARAGLVATAGGITVVAGGASITGDETLAGRLLITPAAAKILGGATSLSLRNNADSADNVLVADAGLVTLRNALSVPTAVGGSLPPTSYGSVWLKHDEQSPSGTGTVTITPPTSGFRDLWIKVYGRGDAAALTVIVRVQFNGDTTAAHYTWSNIAATGASPSGSVPTSDSSIAVGVIPAATATALLPGQIWIEIPEYLNTSFARTLASRLHMQTGGTGFEIASFDGNWINANAITSITVSLSSGNFVSGSRVTTYAIP